MGETLSHYCHMYCCCCWWRPEHAAATVAKRTYGLGVHTVLEDLETLSWEEYDHVVRYIHANDPDPKRCFSYCCASKLPR